MTEARPLELSIVKASSEITDSSAQAMPSAQLGEAQGAIGAWVNTKKLNAMWGINQDRNVFVGVVGVGWKKLSTASASGNVALTMLSAYAKAMQRDYSYREESDGMIHETYVW